VSALKFRFDGKNARAQAEAEKHGAAMVKGIDDETRAAISAVIKRSIAEGIPPHQAAKTIQSIVGLDTARAQSVFNYRAYLVEQQTPLAQLEKLVARYADKRGLERARTIARTESMTALNAGMVAGWQDAKAAGLLSNPVKEVIVTPDDALCEICEPLDGQQQPLDQPFETDEGQIDEPPFHPNCRCTMGLTEGTTLQLDLEGGPTIASVDPENLDAKGLLDPIDDSPFLEEETVVPSVFTPAEIEQLQAAVKVVDTTPEPTPVEIPAPPAPSIMVDEKLVVTLELEEKILALGYSKAEIADFSASDLETVIRTLDAGAVPQDSTEVSVILENEDFMNALLEAGYSLEDIDALSIEALKSLETDFAQEGALDPKAKTSIQAETDAILAQIQKEFKQKELDDAKLKTSTLSPLEQAKLQLAETQKLAEKEFAEKVAAHAAQLKKDEAEKSLANPLSEKKQLEALAVKYLEDDAFEEHLMEGMDMEDIGDLSSQEVVELYKEYLELKSDGKLDIQAASEGTSTILTSPSELDAMLAKADAALAKVDQRKGGAISNEEATAAFKPWIANLQGEQRRAVNDYTGDGYRPMNKLLRDTAEKFDPARESDVTRAINLVDQALAQAPALERDITVYRGSNWNIPADAVEVIDYGYQSTSILPSGAFGGSTRWEITVKAGSRMGAYVRDVSNVRSEYEFLLRRGVKLKIIRIEKSPNGKPKVIAEAVED
jgi:hypothetical protein